jgi:hypothetical protein
MRLAHKGILQYFNLSSFLFSAGYNAAEYDMMNFNRREILRRNADAEKNSSNRTGEGNGYQIPPIRPSQIIKNWLATPLSPGLSSDEQTRVQETFDQLNNTIDGRRLLESIYYLGGKIDLHFISAENIYKQYCSKGDGALLGLFSIKNDIGCTPVIYLASELLDKDFDDWKYWGSSELLTLGYVMAHEFAHYDFHLSEGYCWNNYDSEIYAFSYMHAIFLEINSSIHVYDIFKLFDNKNYNKKGICGE